MIKNYREAPWNRRVMAKLTDAAFPFFAGTIIELPLTWAPPSLRVLGAVLGVLFIPLYLLLADGWEGRSVGKRLFGLKVVNYQTGSPCTFFESFVRNSAFFGIARFWQIAEEESRIGASDYKGTVVIDVAELKNTDTAQSQAAPEPPKPARLDLEGIADFARGKRDPEG